MGFKISLGALTCYLIVLKAAILNRGICSKVTIKDNQLILPNNSIVINCWIDCTIKGELHP